MDLNREKCVLVVDQDLSPGLAANAAAILGITLGRQLPEVVGSSVSDGSGRSHLGIIVFPVPILRGSRETLAALRRRLYEPDLSGLTVADFSDLAQGCRTYSEFTEKMSDTPEEDLRYLALAICGEKKQVNKLTGSLPLLR